MLRTTLFPVKLPDIITVSVLGGGEFDIKGGAAALNVPVIDGLYTSRGTPRGKHQTLAQVEGEDEEGASRSPHTPELTAPPPPLLLLLLIPVVVQSNGALGQG